MYSDQIHRVSAVIIHMESTLNNIDDIEICWLLSTILSLFALDCVVYYVAK